MTLRQEFRDALTLLATAIGRLVERGYSPPILVGGAAVELYTGGAITSGDFDFVSPWRDEFFTELKAVGFEHPQLTGWLNRSLLHPKLDLAVQVVSNPLMDGRVDGNRIQVIDLERMDEGRELKLRVIPVEDLIADRMSQALAGRTLEESMQNQAVRLYQLAAEVDSVYLDGRIRTETGNVASLETLVGWVETCGS